MTREDKELLLKDISARLPYNLIVHIHDIDVIDYDNYLYPDYLEKMMSSSITLKPYLFPLSSMSKEQEQEEYEICKYYIPGYESNLIEINNKNHFDYKKKKKKGLAIDCTNLNIYWYEKNWVSEKEFYNKIIMNYEKT